MTVIGSYKLEKLIGEGGFGRTYLGRHVLLGEPACLKQASFVDPVLDDILMNEARVLWKLHFYSLPTMKDLIRAPDGSLVLVMTFVDGVPLDKLIDGYGKHKKHIDPEHVSWIMSRLLGALHYLHHHGIVHGDIKPANIIQPKEHNAVVVDFGLAKLNPKRTDKALGYTEVYGPPELQAGMPPIPESDIYSLGVTMIHALGGDPVNFEMPRHVPRPLRKMLEEFVVRNPLDRPNTLKTDLDRRLKEIRKDVFGSPASGDKRLEVLK